MENQLTWVGAARWLRDEAGAFIATFWIILVLYGVSIWLAYVWWDVDAEFSRPLAAGVVPSRVTQQMSWAILAFSFVVEMAASWCKHRKLWWLMSGFHALALGAVCLLLMHAFGLSAKIMETQYQRAALVLELADGEGAAVQTNDAKIAALEAQIVDVQKRADIEVSDIEKAWDDERNDGSGSNDAEARETYAPQIAAVRAAARERIADLEDRKLALLDDTGAIQVDAQAEAAEDQGFNPLFLLMSRLATGEWDPANAPANEDQYKKGVFFFFCFWGFAKILMVFLPMMAFEMQLHARAHARAEREKQPKSEPHVRAAETRRKNRETDVRKSRQSGKMIEAAGYYKDAAKRALEGKRKRPRLTQKGLRDSYFPDETVARMNHILETCVQHGHLTQQEYDFLVGIPALNGSGEVPPPPREGEGNDDAGQSDGDRPN